MKLLRLLSLLTVLVALNSYSDTVDQIYAASGNRGGLVVHYGCGDGRLTIALARCQGVLVHGLTRNAADVRKLRALAASKDLAGKVSFAPLSGDKLPYIDNLVRLFVAEDAGGLDMDEVMRVLTPKGVACIKEGGSWKTTVKPWPEKMDEWTHYMHDPGNNAVAHDYIIGPPRHMQWQGGPRWARHHDHVASMNAMVTANGRLVYIIDEGSTASILTPPRWRVIARDAFNGVILWKRDLKDWVPNMWPLKSGPANLPRRLVAVDNEVYAPQGMKAPVIAMDARTGKTIRTYEGSVNTEEILVAGGKLFVLTINKPIIINNPTQGQLKEAESAKVQDRRITNSPLIKYYWGKVQSHSWFDAKRTIRAYDVKSGKALWAKSSLVMPLSMGTDGQRVYYHDGDKIVALDADTGNRVFATEPVAVTKKRMMAFFGPTLVVRDGVIVFAGGENMGLAWMGWESKTQGKDTMTAFSAETGRKLWSAPHPYGGYQSPEDVLIADGLVWAADTANGGSKGPWIGRNLKTGKVEKEIPPTVNTRWFHHRCYRAKATDRFLLPSRNGIECIDIDKKTWGINHWVRSGCLYGIMPANGLIYNSPHNCACHPQAKLYGFNALAAATSTRALPSEIPKADRLEKGPAFGTVDGPPAGPLDWPMYRGAPDRRGSTQIAMGPKLAEAWSIHLPGKLTQPVVAGGVMVVSAIDANMVFGLDPASGKIRWRHYAGGRVDSAPTLCKGMVIFGSADGYVTCLRAADGVLTWRFRAAPVDRRMVAFGQVESVWPVHGSVLVQDDEAYFVAGRSFHLDSGVRFYRLDIKTGAVKTERVMNEKDDTTGMELQAKGGLDMPVALPDILSADGDVLYMRSQLMDRDGKRTKSLRYHLFAPYGYVDDSWFHRAYWVYGKTYYGGCGGYFKAGKKFPSGRMIVYDDDKVYVFGRQQKYFRWITEMEFHLFSSPRQVDDTPAAARAGGFAAPGIQIANSKSLDLKGTPFSVEAWVKAPRGNGVILARGAKVTGFDLMLERGVLSFNLLARKKLYQVKAKQKFGKDWTHVAGVVTPAKEMQLYVNGQLVAKAKGAFLPVNPAEGMEIGLDDQDQVQKRGKKCVFNGMIDEVRLYRGALAAAEVKAHAGDPANVTASARLLLRYGFNDGTAKDVSGNGNNGVAGNVAFVDAKGKLGKAVQITGKAKSSGTPVKTGWSQNVPILVRAMAKAGDTIFIAGPPDLVNEAAIVQQMPQPKAMAALAEQDAALRGKKGALLWAVSAKDGSKLAAYNLDALPAFDGISIAGKHLFLATETGILKCMRAD